MNKRINNSLKYNNNISNAINNKNNKYFFEKNDC